MNKATKLYVSKASIHLIGLFTFILLFAIGSAAEAKGNVDSTRFSRQMLGELVNEAHAKFKDIKSGENADYIPILAQVPSELFGVVIALRDGTIFTAGDVDYAFAIESVSKPFTLAMVMQQYGGPQSIIEKIGVESTGLPFNSKLAVELLKARSVNPLVNAGAMASVSMVKANSAKERWALILENMSNFAGEPLKMMDEVFQSEYTTA